MIKKLHNLFVELTTTAAVVVALTLAGFGFLEVLEPRMTSSGNLREQHLIGCPVCRDNKLPVEEQLRHCPGLADLQQQLRASKESYPDAEAGPATAVAGQRLAWDPGAE